MLHNLTVSSCILEKLDTIFQIPLKIRFKNTFITWHGCEERRRKPVEFHHAARIGQVREIERFRVPSQLSY